jgi:glycosyltransferase involved in cell wall biosynthesis
MKLMKSREKLSIYFAFPYKGIGGCSVLFLRMANYLHGNNIANCFLIDYEDGYMARENKNLQLLEYGKEKIRIPDYGVLVTQSTPPWSIYKHIEFSSQSRIFYWNCHPFNLVPTIPGIRKISTMPIVASILRRSILKKYYTTVSAFVNYLNDTNSLIFMDGENLRTTEKFLNINLKNPKLIPIPIEPEENKWIKRESGVVNVLWVGRIVDFKFYPLLNALMELDKLKNRNISATIVGSGDYINTLKKKCLQLKNLNIKFIDEITHDKLKNFMLNYDLVFAMGTTALESSSIGVPTVLLDPSYGKVKHTYKFRWLYETKNYDLGSFSYHEECDNFKSSNSRGMNNIIGDLDEDAQLISSRCYEYANGSHGLEKVSFMLVQALNKCRSTYLESVAYDFSRPDVFYKAIKSFKI